MEYLDTYHPYWSGKLAAEYDNRVGEIGALLCWIVLRDSPVRRLISRIDCFSRSAIRRMMFESPMWITPSLTALGEGSHGSVLNGNYLPNRLSSAWKPTGAADKTCTASPKSSFEAISQTQA